MARNDALIWIVGGDEEISSKAGREKLDRWLVEVAEDSLDFLVLEDPNLPGFVQTTSTGEGRLVAECRHSLPGATFHVRFRRPVDPTVRLPPVVEGYEGFLEAEALSVGDVRAIFEAFIRDRKPAAGYEAHDILPELGQA